MQKEHSTILPPTEFQLGNRFIGSQHPPLVIAEIGINHNGDVGKAIQMVDDAKNSGCECVKFQSHVIDDEMIKNDVVPGNASEGIWEIISKCVLTKEEEQTIKHYVEQQGMIFLSTPFSRAAADRLQSMEVIAYKIGSGECNNYPLIAHIAACRRPVILSTGMNDLDSIRPAVDILRTNQVSFAILHCTSIYPTPYNKVRLGALRQLSETFPDAVIGLSDHSIGNYTCFAAVALGHGAILEKHFTSTHEWSGPDISLSILPTELHELIKGSAAIFSALGGEKTILPEEQPTIQFAYASVVSTKPIRAGEQLSEDNCWVKRPGTGDIPAKDYDRVLGMSVNTNIVADVQITWGMLDG